MSTGELYKSFARKCFRWAVDADLTSLRSTCLEMAKAWTQLADQSAQDETPDWRPTIFCVQCGERMTLSGSKPIRSSGLKEIAYVCLSCGATTTRFVPAR